MGESTERCIRTPFYELLVAVTVYESFFLLKAEHIVLKNSTIGNRLLF